MVLSFPGITIEIIQTKHSKPHISFIRLFCKLFIILYSKRYLVII
jgi:hypothetical protein